MVNISWICHKEKEKREKMLEEMCYVNVACGLKFVQKKKKDKE